MNKQSNICYLCVLQVLSLGKVKYLANILVSWWWYLCPSRLLGQYKYKHWTHGDARWTVSLHHYHQVWCLASLTGKHLQEVSCPYIIISFMPHTLLRHHATYFSAPSFIKWTSSCMYCQCPCSLFHFHVILLIFHCIILYINCGCK